MFLSELRQVLLRRWYLVLFGLVVTAGAAFATLEAVPPEYSVKAETLMLPPASSVPEGSNPYLALGGLSAVGDVLSKSLSSDASVTAIKASGGTSAFVVELDPDTPAPLVLVTVTTSTPSGALKTLDVVLGRVPDALQQIQVAASVPAKSFITSSLVTKSQQPVKSSKPQLRALVVVVAGCMAATLMGVAFIDSMLRRRTSRSTTRGSRGRSRTSRREPGEREVADAVRVPSKDAQTEQPETHDLEGTLRGAKSQKLEPASH